MRVVVDIETNRLENPDKIWLIVGKDLDSGEYHIFRRVTDDLRALQEAREFFNGCEEIIGHHALGFDVPVVARLLGLSLPSLSARTVDTLVVSKLVNYSQEGHSIEYYGSLFGLPKGTFTDFSQYSEEMEEYCVRDVDICEAIYRHYGSIISDPKWSEAIKCEHQFQLVVNDLHDNGFCFDVAGARTLLRRVEGELSKLDEEIHASFPPRLKLIREIVPTITKHGTLHRKDFRFVGDGDLSEYNGGPFCRCSWSNFNPASHKQVVNILHEAGWRPTDRTATAIKAARSNRFEEKPVDIVDNLKYSWKINEANLNSLPETAPKAARTLARRILIESRRRTLTEWLGLVDASSSRIHGKFFAIGAWTQRMAHQAPNCANIPNGTDTQGKPRPYGAEMRALWCAPPGRHLVGVDAEGIQLRIFAHYIDDEEFTYALSQGRKEDKTDPHSLNQRVLGSVCRSRAAAKRFIYALLLGAGIRKLSEILETDDNSTTKALDRLLQRYTGFAKLKQTIIPADAARGFFVGLDGRQVKILGDTEDKRRHLAMSGYLQNGEVVVMKHATLRWYEVLRERGIDFKLVNMVHDEWQTECSDDLNTALAIAYEQAESLRWVGEKFGLKCPLAGSFYNDDLKDYTIGKNWKVTH
jgi:DNA polymerase I